MTNIRTWLKQPVKTRTKGFALLTLVVEAYVAYARVQTFAKLQKRIEALEKAQPIGQTPMQAYASGFADAQKRRRQSEEYRRSE